MTVRKGILLSEYRAGKQGSVGKYVIADDPVLHRIDRPKV